MFSISVRRTAGTAASTLALFFLLTGTARNNAVAQSATTPQPQRLSPEKIVDLLRQPNGLAEAAKLVGHFELNGQGRLWGHPNLNALIDSSDLIVVGKLTSAVSRLTDDGDDIWTDYELAPEKTIKGETLGNVEFTVPGGLITFPNGTSAEIITVQWQQLQIGQQYAVLLQKSPRNGRYDLANGLEALFTLSTHDGKVAPFASRGGKGSEPLANEVKNTSVSAFLQRLQSRVAAHPKK